MTIIINISIAFSIRWRKILLFQRSGIWRHITSGCTVWKSLCICEKNRKRSERDSSFRTLRCGVGTIVSNLTNIKLSFRNARAAVSYAKFEDSKCISFDEMGFYKMLFSSEDQKILREYTTCLEPILSYDRKHNSELVKTLAVYLKSGRSIQRVASELSCHRNTINYRMGRIEELLYLDINDYENAFILELAFRVLNISSS